MTIGVGGKTPEQALATLSDMTEGFEPIGLEEFKSRIAKAQKMMAEKNWAALYLHAGSSLYYFTGTRWPDSERMVGALILAEGDPVYISPAFEVGTLNQFMTVKSDVLPWEEHESPYPLMFEHLAKMGVKNGMIGIDEATPFFVSDGLAKAGAEFNFTNGSEITAECRMIKSEQELNLMRRAKEMTLEVHKAAASMLREGITTAEVNDFLHTAHQKVGAPKGSFFKIVLFGPDSSFPHGVKNPKPLEKGDMVLIDTGCQLHDYLSDITRSYVFGEPNDRQREVWEAEKAAQVKAFEAARLGEPCAAVDIAARDELEKRGFGPGYKTPGLPHRTGHGIGLDIHEWPYLHMGDKTPLAPGMCFSNEPMIVLEGEFGVRLEDHFYVDKDGPVWFTQPSHSLDNPFGG